MRRRAEKHRANKRQNDVVFLLRSLGGSKSLLATLVLLQNGKWNGLMGELVSKKFDMVLTSLKVNAEREAAVDFTSPFLESGTTILVAKRTGIISPTAFLGNFRQCFSSELQTFFHFVLFGFWPALDLMTEHCAKMCNSVLLSITFTTLGIESVAAVVVSIPLMAKGQILD